MTDLDLTVLNLGTSMMSSNAKLSSGWYKYGI
jgi:hypothetical protein